MVPELPPLLEILNYEKNISDAGCCDDGFSRFLPGELSQFS